VLDGAALLELQTAARAVRVDRSIGRYIIGLAAATRKHPQLRMGCSPRGALALFRVAQARALVSGRDYVVPEDVKAVAIRTLAHRLALDTKAKYSESRRRTSSVRSSSGSPLASELPPSRQRQATLLSLVAEYVRRDYFERLTARGRYVFWATLVLGGLGVDTSRSQSFLLFSIGAAALVLAFGYTLMPGPRARLECLLPARAAARTPLGLRAVVSSTEGGACTTSGSRSRGPATGGQRPLRAPEILLEVEADRPREVSARFEAVRRGRYLLPGPTLRRTDPLRLLTSRALSLPDQVLLAYPRFFTLEQFSIPIGRRYQPGGIPLSSNLASRSSSWEPVSTAKAIRSGTSTGARGRGVASPWSRSTWRSTSAGSRSSSTPSSRRGDAPRTSRPSRRRSRWSPRSPTSSAAASTSSTSWPPARTSTR